MPADKPNFAADLKQMPETYPSTGLGPLRTKGQLSLLRLRLVQELKTQIPTSRFMDSLQPLLLLRRDGAWCGSYDAHSSRVICLHLTGGIILTCLDSSADAFCSVWLCQQQGRAQQQPCPMALSLTEHTVRVECAAGFGGWC